MKLTFEDARIVGIRAESNRFVTELKLVTADEGSLANRTYFLHVPGRLGNIGDSVNLEISTTEEKAKVSHN
jgi:hypothetical protein